MLALDGGLNDAQIWFVGADDALSSNRRKKIKSVLNAEKTGLDRAFSEQQVFSYDYVTGLTADDPSTTPIAWSRGLHLDGTWDPGAYLTGAGGGYIVYLDGKVRFYRNPGSGDLGQPVGRDGEKTFNILETLPPGTRVVGGGPGSLDGGIIPER